MEYFCEICKKKYLSYQSFWNHNRKYHLKQKEIILDTNKKSFSYCEHCNKKFVNKYTLNVHIKSNCYVKQYNENKKNNDEQNKEIIPTQKINKNNNDEIKNDEIKLKLKLADIELEKMKIEQKKLDIEKIKEEKEILKLKLDSKQTTNINTNTNSNNSIKNINNLLNSNNNSNNNVTNNFKIYNLGSENVLETLTLAEKKEIIKAKFSCLETATEIITCGKYTQFKNIFLTNLKDEYAFKFDRKLNKFICGDKNEIMSEFIDERLGNIKEIYEELDGTNKLDPQTKKLIQDFFDQMNDESKYVDQISGKTWKNFRTFKEHNVKILIYNNSDQNTKDLAIILGDTKNDIDINLELDQINNEVKTNTLDV